MNEPTPFDGVPAQRPPPDKSDATPSANGARVNISGSHSKPTRARRRVRVQQTSRAAYLSLGPESRTQAARIYAGIIAAGPGGLTDEEGQLALGVRVQSYTARRNELAADGLIVDSGRTRPTTSGRAAIVWTVSTAATMPHDTADEVGGTAGRGVP